MPAPVPVDDHIEYYGLYTDNGVTLIVVVEVIQAEREKGKENEKEAAASSTMTDGRQPSPFAGHYR